VEVVFKQKKGQNDLFLITAPLKDEMLQLFSSYKGLLS
jgi:hypothetical protein